MTVDLILHGVPNGQDIWGVSDDTHYISTFYVQKDEREYLSIEARKVDGKRYCYYNFLKYNGVTASDERAGAYIGITLRFDAYYKDVLNVYHLCEIVYNNLLDKILVKNGDNVKFKIAKFEDAEQELTEIKKKMFNLLNFSATAKDFTPINDTFFKNDAKTLKAFLLDCTPENVMQALVKYGKVEISRYLPSVNESKRLKSVEERFNAIIAQKDIDLQNANSQIGDLTSERQRLQSDLQDKTKEINELNSLISEKEDAIKNNEEAIKEVSTYINKSKELQSELDSARGENEQLKGLISRMENTIKKNEATVKEADAMKRQIQELKSYLQKQNKEIEQIKTELIEYKSNSTSPDFEYSAKRSHDKRKSTRGRQTSSHSNSTEDYYSEDYCDDSYNRKSVLEKISSFWILPLWQKITIIVIVLTLLCSSIYGVIRLCSSEDRKANSEQPTDTSSYTKNEDEHPKIDVNMDYSNINITPENISNTDNDEDE